MYNTLPCEPQLASLWLKLLLSINYFNINSAVQKVCVQIDSNTCGPTEDSCTLFIKLASTLQKGRH